MTKTNNKKLNTELITSLSNEDYRKLVDKDCQNQFQMGGYMCTIISNEKGYRNWDGMYWVDSDGKLWPYIGRLYHANSVPTAFDYISRGFIYSRQKGDEFNKQTAQRSDELDKALGIYNDIFFDTSDIPYCVGTNTSAYGPIMFVLKPQVIKGKRIRVTKLNPFVKNNLTYDSLYYKDVDGIKLLGVKTLNNVHTSIIEKGISLLTLENLYIHAIKKYLPNISFDIILSSTPPIMLTGVVKFMKRRCPMAITYLLLKDIFPQNGGIFLRCRDIFPQIQGTFSRGRNVFPPNGVTFLRGQNVFPQT